jgi:hypothetical protein
MAGFGRFCCSFTISKDTKCVRVTGRCFSGVLRVSEVVQNVLLCSLETMTTMRVMI